MTGNDEYGVVQRGARDYSLMYGYAPGFFAYGAADLDSNLKPVFNSPAAVEYTQLYGDTLRKYGPPGQTNVGWDQVVGDMASGTIGCTVDDMAFADTYENPAKSKIAGKTVYANPPAGPGGAIKIPVWYWALSLPSKSTSHGCSLAVHGMGDQRQTMKVVTAQQHAMIPVRKSIWEDPAMVDITKELGQLPRDYRCLAPILGQLLHRLAADGDETGPWVIAIQQTILGEKTAKGALDAAVSEFGEDAEGCRLLREAGSTEEVSSSPSCP